MVERLDLVSDSEEFPIWFGESAIYARRLKGSEQERIIRKHDRKGKPNWTGALYDMVALAITRFHKIRLDGKIVEWDPSLVHRIPRDAIDRVAEEIGADVPGTDAYEAKVAEAKNSKTTSGSNTTTKE
jgi:hypothetical protein